LLKHKLDKQVIFDYLNNPESSEIQQMIDQGNEAFYNALVSALGYPGNNPDMLFAVGEIQGRTPHVDESKKELIDSLGLTNPFILKNEISEMRALALAQKHLTRENPVNQYRERFFEGLAEFIRGSDYELPGSYRVIWGDRPLPEAGIEKGLEQAVRGVIAESGTHVEQQYKEMGADPDSAASFARLEITDRLEDFDEKGQAAAETITQQIEYIVQNFPDPRVIADLLLRAEKGDLPI
jgi:hypothetical protein